jgi:ribose transport system substrate-binding protein
MEIGKSDRSRDPYFVQSVAHAADVLRAFSTPTEVLRLRDIVARTSYSKGIAFRILYTLEKTGLLEKVGVNQYRSTFHHRVKPKYKIGYAAPGSECLFSQQVTSALKHAARQTDALELLTLNNGYSAKVAQKNIDTFVREQCDLVIEFQTDESIASVLSAKCKDAKIPLIAVELPHPGAIYYGANSYEAGLTAGRGLGSWAKRHWDGHVDGIVLIGMARAGTASRSQVMAMMDGMRRVLPHLDVNGAVHLDGDGRFERTWRIVRKHLQRSASCRTLVGAINDASALGALRAFEEAGRVNECAVMGQNASPAGRDELRRSPRFIGSVAYFPERYGEGLVKLAMDVLSLKPVPPAVFVPHQLLTAKNVDHFYPSDQLSLAACAT